MPLRLSPPRSWVPAATKSLLWASFLRSKRCCHPRTHSLASTAHGVPLCCIFGCAFLGTPLHARLWRPRRCGARCGEVGRAPWRPGGAESPWALGARCWGRGWRVQVLRGSLVGRRVGRLGWWDRTGSPAPLPSPAGSGVGEVVPWVSGGVVRCLRVLGGVPCARRVLALVSWFPASRPGGGSSCGGSRSGISVQMPSSLTRASETRSVAGLRGSGAGIGGRLVRTP